MPKRPILERSVFYDVLSDATLMFLDFNVVETELGTMVEGAGFEGGYGTLKVTDQDVFDASITRIVRMDRNIFTVQYGSGGNQIPTDFSPQGA